MGALRTLRAAVTSRAWAGRHDDQGSVLIFALVYLVATGVTMFALMGWISNGLDATSKFSTARELQLGATSTAELAIQSIRYTPLLSSTTSGASYCWGGGPTSGVSHIDGNSFDAWCSTAWNPTSAQTRVVTISVCLSSVSQATCTSSTPYLQVTVTFDDYPPGGAAAVQGACTDWGWCGEGMTIDSWNWS